METLQHKYKSFTNEILELKEEGNTGLVTFAFSKFLEVDSYGDRVFKGAFKKTINENFKRIFWNLNHDRYIRPGIILKLWEDSQFAYSRVKANLEIPIGREVFLQEKFFYENKQPLEHSYKYDAIDFSENEYGGYDLKQIRLYEVSTLYMWGANAGTPTTAVKSYSEIEKKIYELENIVNQLKAENQTLINSTAKNSIEAKKPIDWAIINKMLNK